MGDNMISAQSTCALNDCAAECRHNPTKPCVFRRPPRQPAAHNPHSATASSDFYAGPLGTPYQPETPRRAVR